MSFLAPFAPAMIGGIGSLLGGFLGGSRGPKETEIQKRQRNTVDEILASLRGNGPYSDLFSPSEEAFERSFVQPSLSRFENQIAPAIQQQFIQSGLQRSSGLDNALTQAGVDMNQMLNQQYLNYLNSAQGRQQNALSSILGMGPGAPQRMSNLEAAGRSLGGYLSSPSFIDLINRFSDGNQTSQRETFPVPESMNLPGFNPYQQRRIGFFEDQI